MRKIYDTTHDSEVRESDIAPTLVARMGTGGNMIPMTTEVIAIRGNVIGRKPKNGGNGLGCEPGLAPTLTTIDRHGVMDQELRVRKLTPVECERLQGFPDNYTRISWRGKPEEECPDGLRYKAIGNSWAVPVINWIGRRIAEEMK